MSLVVGQRLGPYEVLALLGAGGMGEVYRARDTSLGRVIVLKILPDGVAHFPYFNWNTLRTTIMRSLSVLSMVT